MSRRNPARTAWLLVPLLAVTFVPVAGAAPAFAGLKPQMVLKDLAGPIDIAIADDGAIWWNEYYSGNVSRFDPTTDTRQVKFHADPIPNGVERGIVGLALDPKVSETGVFYVYYTVENPADAAAGTNRLVKVTEGTESLILTVPAAAMHNGGRIVIAKDGSLFVSTGENDKGKPAQDPSTPLGKILHVAADGTPAPGNVQGYVYTLGHRNVYGLAYDAATGRLFATENGNAERDEVNFIEAGKNYGWPLCEGTVKYNFAKATDSDDPCDDPAFTPPIGEFYETRTAAPTGATIFRGALYWASWNEGAIHRMTETGPGIWEDEVVFQVKGRINDLEASPDGKSLYYSNWTHIMRLDVPENLTPPQATFNTTSAAPTRDTATGASITNSPAAPWLAGVAVGLGVVALLRSKRAKP